MVKFVDQVWYYEVYHVKYERYVGGYRWDIFSWELVGGEGYEQTGFTNSTIAHDNTLGEDKLKKNYNNNNNNSNSNIPLTLKIWNTDVLYTLIFSGSIFIGELFS